MKSLKFNRVLDIFYNTVEEVLGGVCYCGNKGGKKAPVKRYETVIYWEQDRTSTLLEQNNNHIMI